MVEPTACLLWNGNEEQSTKHQREVNRTLKYLLKERTLTEEGGRRACEDYFVVNDRADTIAFAIGMARAGNVVIVCGKGHERSMCFGTTEIPWSDQDAVRQAIRQK